jgi:hypothetical protein
MPLTSSGQISLNDLHVEAGGTTGTQASMNDADIRGLLGAAANSQMTFSSFYGASAGIGQIASGNSTYLAGGDYSAPSYNMRSTLHTPSVNFDGSAYVTTRPTFTMNGRSTQFMRLLRNISNDLMLDLFDLSSSVASESATNTAGFPANSGFTRMKLKNSSGTVIRNLTRSSATYSSLASQGYNGDSFRYVGRWLWAGTANPFPSSDNTTQFSIELE